MRKLFPDVKTKKELANKNMIVQKDQYDKSHCWQYDIRLKNSKTDLEECRLTEDDVKDLRTSDFEFKIITNDFEKKSLVAFIQKHEWLGTISQFTTHWFGAYLIKGNRRILAGVILMNIPNAFSKLLGENTSELERLVSRGACISWSPKNLASNFLMWCIRWMVKNTPYRMFSAYSDPSANELGTIYQACNWIYLGKDSGHAKRYKNPYNGKITSDRVFRQKRYYKKYAQELGIKWQDNWENKYSILWENMPDDYEEKIRARSREVRDASECFVLQLKHKYIYILGKDKKETKELRKKFYELNPKMKGLKYPTKRGE